MEQENPCTETNDKATDVIFWLMIGLVSGAVFAVFLIMLMVTS